MKRFFSDIRVKKLFLPLAFLLIFSVWCADRWGDPYNPLCYGALILGVLFFILDRQLKPRMRERLVKNAGQAQPDATEE